MGNKKVTKPSDEKNVDIEIIAETEIVEIETFDVSSIPSSIRDRIFVLVRRRNQFGDFGDIIIGLLNGEPMPSDEDGWMAFANSLER